MLQVITDLLGSMMSALALFYAIFKISNQKINYKSKKFWLCIIGYALYSIIIYKITANFSRVILSYVVAICISCFVFKIPLLKSLLASFFAFLVLFLSESIFVAVSMFILKVDLEVLKQSYLAGLTSNLFIAFMMFLLINIMHTKKMIKELFEQLYIKKNKIIISVFVLTILSFSILLYSIFFDISTTYALCLNVALIIIYSILVINIFSQTNKNEKLQQDYDLKINELSEYEKALIEKRKILHNHDNDLIVIRGMIKYKKENKKAINYINSLLKESNHIDKLVLQKVEYIPEGGLQGLIHQKIELMKQNNINVYLQVNDNISEINFNKINSKKNKDICTIIGIFLDNALEASADTIQKSVSIVLTKEKKNLVINISNSFKGRIDASKIDEAGYSTKGSNRGFGLDIVKTIIEKNNYIENERHITSNIFNQKLIIKIK